MWWSGVDATYVSGPPRHGWLALWTTAGAPVNGADAELELVLPAGAHVRERRRPVDGT